MRTLLQIVAVLGYLTAACALTTSLYKPLPSLSLEILGLIGVVVHLALGLIFGRWWAVLLPALPLAVAAFVLRDQPWAIVAIPFAVVVALTSGAPPPREGGSPSSARIRRGLSPRCAPR